MAKVTLISAVKHDGKDYKPGDTFEGDKKIVNELIRAGAAQDPSTVVEQTSAIETAEDEAKTIVAEAQKDADKIKSDAEDEAKTIIGKAEELAGRRSREPRKPSPTPRPKRRSSSMTHRTPLRRLQTQRPTHLRSRTYDVPEPTGPPERAVFW